MFNTSTCIKHVYNTSTCKTKYPKAEIYVWEYNLIGKFSGHI